MKNLLLVALMFIGLNTFAQKPNLSQDEMRRELRDLKFAGPNYYEPLRGRIILYHRAAFNRPVACKKCVRQYRKHLNNRRHGILRQSYRPLHQPSQRRNFR